MGTLDIRLQTELCHMITVILMKYLDLLFGSSTLPKDLYTE